MGGGIHEIKDFQACVGRELLYGFPCLLSGIILRIYENPDLPPTAVVIGFSSARGRFSRALEVGGVTMPGSTADLNPAYNSGGDIFFGAHALAWWFGAVRPQLE